LFVVLMDELARRAGFQWRNSYGVVSPLPAYSSYTKRTISPWVDGIGRWHALPTESASPKDF
jgi:hypothetical protein